MVSGNDRSKKRMTLKSKRFRKKGIINNKATKCVEDLPFDINTWTTLVHTACGEKWLSSAPRVEWNANLDAEVFQKLLLAIWTNRGYRSVDGPANSETSRTFNRWIKSGDDIRLWVAYLDTLPEASLMEWSDRFASLEKTLWLSLKSYNAWFKHWQRAVQDRIKRGKD